MKTVKLSDEDQQRVDRVTSSGIHSVERKPFRPWVLLLALLVVTSAMTLVSIYLERIAVG